MPEECDGSAPPTWQVTGGVDGMRTTIELGDGTAIALREVAATATLAHFATERLGWSITAGGIVAGSIEGRATRGGGTLAAGVSYLALYEGATRPFISITGSIGTALIRGTADDDSRQLWSAWDARGGVMIGKTLGGRVVPYAAARAFGGPVFWHRGGEAVTGTDRYHVTAGLGVIARLPARIDASLEIMPLGEQSATLGVTTRF